MKLAEAYVDIVARMGTLQAGLNRAQGMIKGFASRAGAWLQRSRMALMAVAGGMIAVMRAAGKQEEADLRVAAALKMIGKYSNEAQEDLKKFATGIQKITTYGDEAVQDLMSLGITLGKLSGTQLKETTRAAIGLAEVIGTDARTAMMLLSRAAQGQFQLFTRYGIVLDGFKTKQEKFAELLRLGAKGFKIQEEKAGGFLGMIQRVTNAFGDMLEEIGLMFTPQGLGGLVTLIENAAENIKDLRYLLGLPMGGDKIKAQTLAVSDLNDKIEKVQKNLEWRKNLPPWVPWGAYGPDIKRLEAELAALIAKRNAAMAQLNIGMEADAAAAGEKTGREWGQGFMSGTIGLASNLIKGIVGMHEEVAKYELKQYETNRDLVQRIAELRFKAADDEWGLRKWALNEETNYLLKQGTMRKDLIREAHQLGMQAIEAEQRKEQMAKRRPFTDQWWYWKKYLQPQPQPRVSHGVIIGRDILRQRQPERFNLGAGGRHDELTALQKIEKNTEKTAEALAAGLVARYN